MEEESNIRKAQPKEGLQTGSLEGSEGGLQTGSLEGAEGGLSAKQQVAQQYEPALSGSKGPDARFDAIQELIDIRVREANNSLTFSSPSGTQIFGLNGKYSITGTVRRTKKQYVAPVKASSNARLWDIDIVDADAGTVRIGVPGSVRITDDVDSTGLIEIRNINSVFSISVGRYIVLEWDATSSPPVCTLKALSTWSDFPFPYTTAPSGEHKIFQKGYTPLWVARASSAFPVIIDGIHVALNDNITMVRLAPDAHFEVINYLVELPSGQMADVDRLMAGCGAG